MTIRPQENLGGGTFAELYCELAGLDMGDYRETVLRRTLYPAARVLRPILQQQMHYFSPDYEFVEGVGQIRSSRDLAAEIESYLQNPANTGFKRKHLKLRVSIRRMERLVGRTLREPVINEMREAVLRPEMTPEAAVRAPEGVAKATPDSLAGIPGAVAAPVAHPAPGGLRVLLVEDNRVTQQFMTIRLTKLGCAVTSAENGVDALALFEEQPFDLIIMDHQMPQMTGAQAAWRIRRLEAGQQEKGQRVNPVYIAAFAAALEDRQKGRESGMNDYLAKPVDVAALGELLERAAKARGVKR